ncbi:hypothetical protein Bbelb_334650 [Branchiostoma belcheri]|nr:hypothetical protein Bbelb_334650 [Branchiostoma belcheri]
MDLTPQRGAKAWVEWAQEILLTLLRDVAATATTEDYDEAISRLHESQLWGENERLRSWLNNKYVQLNVAFSSCYRKYHSNIPTYLQDRPRGVVNHILPRLTEAQCYEPGVFKVTSKGGISQHYHTVNFETSSTNNMPSCTCRDWAKHKMPCKHFCAIFTLEEGWTWDKLSPAYRDNPLFSLDDIFLASSSYTSSSCDDDSWMEDTTPTVELDLPALSPSPPVYSDLPVKRKSRLNKLRRECASLLHEMTNVTYNLQDEVYLTAVKDELTTMYEEMLGRAPHDNTIPLRSPQKRKREAADHDNLHCLQSTLHHTGVYTREEAPELETIVVNCELEVINKIQLSQKDREALQKGQWLTDKHMNAAQHLIKSEYPLIDGLRDTFVLMAYQSGPVKATSASLQVHNTKDHWVLSSSTWTTNRCQPTNRPSPRWSHRQRSSLPTSPRKWSHRQRSRLPTSPRKWSHRQRSSLPTSPGSGAAYQPAPGSGATGSGAVYQQAPGSGATGSGAVYQPAPGSGATGSGAAYQPAPGSGATGSGAAYQPAPGSGATGSRAAYQPAPGSGATGSGAAYQPAQEVEQPINQPQEVEQQAAEQSTNQPQEVEPQAAEQSTNQPQEVEPQAAEQPTNQPQEVEPQAAEQPTNQPQEVEPQAAEQPTNQPQEVKPQAAEPPTSQPQ